MKRSMEQLGKDLIGKWVTIQLDRPLYICDYGAHVSRDGDKQYVCEPVTVGEGESKRPVAMELLIGVEVVAVGDNHLVVEVITMKNHILEQTIRTSDIAAIYQLVTFEPEKLPDVSKRERAAAAPSTKIIL